MSPFDMYSLLYKSLASEDREFVCSLILEVGRSEARLKILRAIVKDIFGDAVPDNEAGLPPEAHLERCVEYIMVGFSLKYFTRAELAKQLGLTPFEMEIRESKYA